MGKLEASPGCGCDAVRHTAPLLKVTEALERLLGSLPCADTWEEVDVAQACGRVSAEQINAPVDMPLFDNSAMDGIAVQTDKLKGSGPWLLPILDHVYAGSSPDFQSLNGQSGAVRIFTGAPVPAGFDAVIMQEECVFNKETVSFAKVPPRGSNIRRHGTDVNAGDCLVRKHKVIEPFEIGLLSALGIDTLCVYRKPRIGVFSTGNELVEAGSVLPAGKIYDSNRPLVCALCRASGAEVFDLGILPDDLDEITQKLDWAQGHYDLLLSSGAVSVGNRDYILPALENCGADINFWRVAIKPGKPILSAKLGDTAFVGLPGNPLAVHVGFNVFVKPMIDKISGQDHTPANLNTGRAGFHMSRKAGRQEYLPVRVSEVSDASRPILQKLGNGGSGSLAPLVGSDGFAVIPASVTEINIGDKISWQKFSNS